MLPGGGCASRARRASGPGATSPTPSPASSASRSPTGTPVRTLRLAGGSEGVPQRSDDRPVDGTLYTTNTSTGAVLQATRRRRSSGELLPDDAVPGANGIALDANGRVLLRRRRRGHHPRGPRHGQGRAPRAGGTDRRRQHRRSLLRSGSAGGHPERGPPWPRGPLLPRRLSSGGSSASEVLEAYAPWMDGPTTGAIDGDSLLYLANTQLRRWRGPGAADGLVPVQVRRVSLSRR